MSEPWTLTARWVFPVERPPLAGGTITILDTRILAVEPHGTQVADVDLGDAVIIPGLVNAHTHLDLTGARGQTPPTPDFTSWLRQVIQYRRGRAADLFRSDIRAGLAESLAFGTTLLGDISGDGASWDIIVGAPVRAVVFRELLGLPEDRAFRAWQKAEGWLGERRATSRCRPGLSPHSPYSVRASLFLLASTAAVPWAIHVAESAAERELLGQHSGPFVSFLQELGAWAPDGLVDGVEDVLQLFNGTVPALFVHGNFLKPDAGIPPNGSVIYCPRTHAAFGHPPHPFRDMMQRGVRVALGTDSLASNPDLSILEEIRFLHRLYPEVPGAVLLRMATLSGAEALGWDEATGSLAPGKSADLVVVPMSDKNLGDPHQTLLESAAAASQVMFQGRWQSASEKKRDDPASGGVHPRRVASPPG
jgi:cytosine/adenosine deaminase-related metal-dependent hydrolase